MWSVAIIFMCVILRRFPWTIPDPKTDPSFKAFIAGHPDLAAKPRARTPPPKKTPAPAAGTLEQRRRAITVWKAISRTARVRSCTSKSSVAGFLDGCFKMVELGSVVRKCLLTDRPDMTRPSLRLPPFSPSSPTFRTFALLFHHNVHRFHGPNHPVSASACRFDPIKLNLSGIAVKSPSTGSFAMTCRRRILTVCSHNIKTTTSVAARPLRVRAWISSSLFSALTLSF